MAEQLTPQQELAVKDRGGNLLVSAAAGSGKTKVLVERLVSYIKDPVNPANINDFLIITFTQAAAAELRAKIAAKLSQEITDNPGNLHLQRQMQLLHTAKISTVHSFCGDILREYAYRLDISADFRTMDDNEAMALRLVALERTLETAYEQLVIGDDISQFVDFQGFGRDDSRIEGILLQVYENARCHLNPEKWLDWCMESSDTKDVEDASQTVWGAYLISDLRKTLEAHKNVYLSFADEWKDISELSSQTALISDTAAQLDRLLMCSTWDEIYGCLPISYGTFNVKKYLQYAPSLEQAAAFRKMSKAYLDKKLLNFGTPSSQILLELAQSNQAGRGLVALVRAFTKEYAALKRQRRVLDFSDLEHMTLDLLYGRSRSGLTSVARELSGRFREVLVDEYQDTNEVQDAIYAALTADRNNCFMVGDVKQSIYQFRQANPQIFIDKYNAFVHAESAAPGQDRKILLSKNFRSSKKVICGVNDVFQNCMSPEVGGIEYGEGESLQEGVSRIPLPDPEVSLFCVDVKSDTYEEEASFVAQRIYELISQKRQVRDGDTLRPVEPGDIAILLRSPKTAGSYFQRALEERGIPCDAGMTDDVFACDETLTLIAMLKVIENPLQDVSLTALLSSRLFCFSADDLAQICGTSTGKYIYEKLLASSEKKAVCAVEIIEKLRDEARILRLPQLLERIFALTQIDSIFSGYTDGAIRTNHLQTIFRLANEFDAIGGKDLRGFVEYLHSVAESRKLEESSGASNAVLITSIHKSKGLEYPVVFLPALSKRFNLRDTQAPVLCDKTLGLGLYCVDINTRFRTDSLAKKAIALKMRKDAISEELRVLYVAMTRARDRLVMTYALNDLEAHLRTIIMEMDAVDMVYMCQNVRSAGEWVLLTALKRTESGELFAIGGKPGCTQVSDVPWDVHVVSCDNSVTNTLEAEELTVCQKPYSSEELQASLEYRYEHIAASKIPSKLTATQMKGREKDIEAAADSTECNQVAIHHFRKAGLTHRSASAADRGTAYHKALQYMEFSNCTSIENLHSEILRIQNSGLLTQEQADWIDPATLYAFFTTQIGTKLRDGCKNVREFKFSVLEQADKFYDDVNNEQILLQGVVDCALLENDGITIIDFKSDLIQKEEITNRASTYKEQVLIYANALERIFQKPIKACYLYFISCSELIEIS